MIQPMTRSLALVPLALLFGCATPMVVSTTPPGADITVDGKPVGKSPATAQIDSGGGPVTVRAKISGRPEVTKSVSKDQINWAPVAAGAAAGVGTFCATLTLSGVIGVFVPVLNFVTCPLGCLGCASVVAAPVGAYFLWGSKPPEQVTVELGSSVAPAPYAEAPIAPTSPDAPPPPPAPLTPETVQPY